MWRSKKTQAAFFEVQFHNEDEWRRCLDRVIDEVPNPYLEPTGRLGFIVDAATHSWVQSHIDSSTYSSHDLSKRPEDDRSDLDEDESFAHRGKGLSPEFDDPDWLEREAKRLEEETKSLKAKIE